MLTPHTVTQTIEHARSKCSLALTKSQREIALVSVAPIGTTSPGALIVAAQKGEPRDRIREIQVRTFQSLEKAEGTLADAIQATRDLLATLLFIQGDEPALPPSISASMEQIARTVKTGISSGLVTQSEALGGLEDALIEAEWQLGEAKENIVKKYSDLYAVQYNESVSKIYPKGTDEYQDSVEKKGAALEHYRRTWQRGKR